MVGKTNPSDSSTEVYRGSDPELDSTFESGCSPKKQKINPIKKNKRVKFNLPDSPTTKGSDSEEDYNEEPDSPLSQSPAWPSRVSNAPATSSLNDLNELPTQLETAKDYRRAWCTPEAEQYFAKLTLSLRVEEKETYMSVGRGRGHHQLRNYSCCPPVQGTKEIPHCHGLPVSLATRGALSRPAPGRGCNFCYVSGKKEDAATANTIEQQQCKLV